MALKWYFLYQASMHGKSVFVFETMDCLQSLRMGTSSASPHPSSSTRNRLMSASKSFPRPLVLSFRKFEYQLYSWAANKLTVNSIVKNDNTFSIYECMHACIGNWNKFDGISTKPVCILNLIILAAPLMQHWNTASRQSRSNAENHIWAIYNTCYILSMIYAKNFLHTYLINRVYFISN